MIQRDTFGQARDGRDVTRFTLAAGTIAAEILTLGATLSALRAPDRAGLCRDVTLGFAGLAPYLDVHPYLGSTVGRVANRIGHARFTLDGRTYQLAANIGAHHLHGGPTGFHMRRWDVVDVDDGADPALRLRWVSQAGEEGYPGALTVDTVYQVTRESELRIEFYATCDAPTPVNLTNHAYFNLAGAGDILDHELELHASQFVPTDADCIPFGITRPVAGTPMDFRTATRVGARIAADDEQLRIGHGYDHCWVFDKPAGELETVARLVHRESGRVMELATTQPGVQLYTGNYLDGSLVGRDGTRYGRHAALCLETQHLPDSVNHAGFPSTILRPGMTYHQTTVHRFEVC